MTATLNATQLAAEGTPVVDKVKKDNVEHLKSE